MFCVIVEKDQMVEEREIKSLSLFFFLNLKVIETRSRLYGFLYFKFNFKSVSKAMF